MSPRSLAGDAPHFGGHDTAHSQTGGGPRNGRRAAYNQTMKASHYLTAIIEREDDAYVAFCPELDIASEGNTVEGARQNLIEALELFFETADATEISRRLHPEVFVTRVEIAVG